MGKDVTPQGADTAAPPDRTAADAARFALGRDLLGPVVALFCHRLLAAGAAFAADHGGPLLFVARAGVRINRALAVFAAATGRPMPQGAQLLWTSRLMTAKGIWRRDRAAAIALLEKEFRYRPLRDLVTAMFRRTGLPEGLALADRAFERPGTALHELLAAGGAAARALDRHFEEQAALFEEDLAKRLAGAQAALLVDTGWQGTAQRLLAGAYPEIAWWGAYFGRFPTEPGARAHWPQMLGLILDAEGFEPGRPETAIILHRHLIESLFEPQGPSIERLARGADGAVFAPEAAELLAEDPDGTPVFAGVLAHLAALTPAAGPARLTADGQAALAALARLIVFPTAEEAALQAHVSRSADFGRALSVPLLLPPEDRRPSDTADQRIAAALWPAGQAAREYPPELARPIQRKLAGLSRTQAIGVPAGEPAAPALRRSHPAVAVITRTLDRPVFLKRAIRSVAAQDFDDYVHVIVNDGGDIAEARAAIAATPCDLARVVLVDTVTNRGMEAASNIAIAAAQSDFIVIHDDDDSWEPDFLRETVGFMSGRKGPEYGGVITRATYVSEEVTPSGIRELGRKPYEDWVEVVHLMQMAIGNFFPPIAFLFRRDLYERLGGFDARYPVLGDWDFNLRFLLEADIGVIPKALANYHHRDREGSLAFANSVIGDRDKHREYSAVVRNTLVRRLLAEGKTSAATLIGLGVHTGAQIAMLQGLERRAPQAASPGEGWSRPADDDAWVALQRLMIAAAAGDERLLEQAGVIAPGTAMRGVAGRLRRLFGKSRSRRPRAESLAALTEAVAGSTAALLRAEPASLRPLAPPPDFDEPAYLRDNPDVRAAVQGGRFSSGFEHYWLHGRSEGRPRPARG